MSFSFIKGFIVGVPVALYFGEKDIPFPIVYENIPYKTWGKLTFDL
jgi:hypothetical protein